jgi:hypothetical protein
MADDLAEPQRFSLAKKSTMRLAAIVGRWLLVRSDAPDMDLVTVMCLARGYIERGGAEQTRSMAR